MSHVADSSRNRPFDPIFGAFYPHPAHGSPLRVERANRFLARRKHGWPLRTFSGTAIGL